MTRVKQTKKVPGTVSALRPSQALTVQESLSVLEAAQLMAAKRSDCVLVMDDEDHLCGILTAKDIAYRVVAENLNARLGIQVSEIMTPQPVCVTTDSSAQDALNLMVSRGFRHVPVCSEDGEIYGLLDITKCLYQALDKMERAYGSSQKLLDALEGIEKEWSSSTASLVGYMDTLRTKMSCPTITTVLTQRQPVQVSAKTHVNEVARLMREQRTTAVLVMDHGSLAGIFTTKDIVLRVVAVGLNAANCSVCRFMTPEPETALPETSILDALKKMHNGHFLNLPVVDADRGILGLLDVLSLTYATLELIDEVNGAAAGDDDGLGKDRFWASFAHDDDMTETESMISSTSLHSEARDLVPQQQQQQAHAASVSIVSSQAAGDEASMAFKFAHGEKTFRFRIKSASFDAIKQGIDDKMATEPMPERMKHWCLQDVFYVDEDQDRVVMQSDADVLDAVKLAYRLGQGRIRLFVVFHQDAASCPHHGRSIAREKADGPLSQQGKIRFFASLPISQAFLFPTTLTLFGVMLYGAYTVIKIPKRLY
ncbi:hypothetical protein BC940DRAFT_294780 [Gongronella butleri]|nr:hypothetical protein BC940DRAFT_294780 [Gongronella butleri]